MREGLVSWSLDTLVLALYVIGLLCAVYIAVKVFQLSPKWGALFIVSPVAFFALDRWLGVPLAGLVVLGAQAYYATRSYTWKTVGRIWVYTVVIWLGLSGIHIKQAGWRPGALAAKPEEVEQAGGAAPDAGESYLNVAGGRIWYRVTARGSGTPVVLLHGGPGAASFYLKPLEAIADDRPVVRYDQLGSGHSEKTSDTTLFTIPRYVQELDSLRSALGFARMHLVGHSWGGTLALEYYRAHPEYVASLTLASPVVSGPEWIRATRKLLKTLSDSAQLAVKTREATGDYESPDYTNAVNEYMARYVTLRPAGADLDSTMTMFGQAVYHHMWGPSEFTLIGPLRAFDGVPMLRRIKVPTLYTVGQADEADPATIQRFAKRTPGARYEVIPDAAHIVTWDNPDAFVKVVRDFLRSADSSIVARTP